MGIIRLYDKTYKSNTPECEIPSLDLLTLLFESPYCTAKEDTILHAEAHDPSIHITKSDAKRLTKRLAYVLRNEFGIGSQEPGQDIVLAVSSGQHLLPVIFYAVIAAAGVYTAASPASTTWELGRQIEDGPAKLVICSRDVKHVAVEAAQQQGIAPSRVLVLESSPAFTLESADGSWSSSLGPELEWERITDPDELANTSIALVYSSGTTGPPKGVKLSHTNMIAEALLPADINRRVYASRNEPHLNIRTLAHLPPAHISGVQGYFVNPFLDDGTVFWMPKFSFPDFLKYCKQHSITTFFTPPPVLLAIAKHPLVTDQLRSVRIVYTGAAPINAGLQKAAGAKMGNGSVFISQTWGMTEACGGATHMPPYENDDYVGSVSPLMPNMLLRIVDDDGKDVPDGHSGEALLKGSLLTKGYHNNPQATADSFENGWFRTGDVAQIKDGVLFIVDRKKELIKHKALPIAPAELEALLISHPLVADAAVIGIPTEDGDEVPRAYVVADKSSISAETIIEFVKDNVSEHKQLRGGVVYIDAIPRTPSGKILRKELREAAKQEVATP
ncbi:4-coumarate-CoA ligase [Polyplosphaeria fusca]|uniref:4-coumarate-CoA ligase n=1 Tax=Polyplosphaeria fusca TaxID=682080 RepID=A0A9P4QKN8_9PLEO|nr:4-coumarate-CoA ligase [Polyplosphaeria fusca]